MQYLYDFNDKIFREDKRIVEAQEPECLPLDPRLEAHLWRTTAQLLIGAACATWASAGFLSPSQFPRSMKKAGSATGFWGFISSTESTRSAASLRNCWRFNSSTL